ncbi:tetratricopeptide repeat protein [candidate division KSB1 bacterium]|nr:tetratricopeptide repeat protein [candidate division KSB1 bacterium]NIR69607.1 tetratricopeptide repeat protein [candidate division KSB1 bacterium]NIS24324.1 tetratricopeptide repeat protein [candidate division KSB1 bacterium]NIT71252.1 tetratricopeptide repeat protein [candidate division KSB1 bacterium]NIU24956.1 tetratricopeptide repeat protein [candidate division KSB1 bacterium]
MNRRRICSLFSLGIFLFGLSSCTQQNDRKIRLANTESDRNGSVQAAATVLDVTPEQQHTIAILPFENATENESLDWLSRGLADMLATKLSQSHYINVVAMTRLYASLNQIDNDTEDISDLSTALKAARQADVKTLITGSFYQEESAIKIYAVLRDVSSENVLRKEYVQGPNLERIFIMVDDLSDRLRSNLRHDLEAPPETKSLAAMTQSVEAFRCYSKALESMDKFAYAEAETCLTKAIEIDSTFAKAYLLLGKVKLRMGDSEAAQTAINQADRFAEKLSEPDRIWLSFYKCELTGDINGILESMKQLLQYEPNDPETRMQLAELHLLLKDYDRALSEYEMILDIDPKQKLAYNQVAYIHAYRGDFKTALKYLDKYANIAPDEPNPHDSKGEVLMMAGRMQEAAEQFKMALAKRPSFHSSIMNLCNVYSELDELDRALEYFDQRISQASNQHEKASAFVKRAALFWRFGRISKAEKDLQRAREMDPTSVYPVFIGGEMYESIGDTAAAQQLYKSYAHRSKELTQKEDLNPHLIEGILRFCMNADLPPEEAISILENLNRSETRELLKLQYGMLLSILHLRNGDYEEALQYCEEKRGELFGLLVQFPNHGWSNTWKYIVEAVQLEPKQEEPDLTFVTNLFQAAKKAGRKDLQVIARFINAQYFSRYGESQELLSVYRELGAPLEEHWRVVGPFENRSGFHRRFPPEESIDLTATYESAGRKVRWQKMNDGTYDGYVNLRTALQPSSWAVGYGLVYIHSPEKRKVQLRLATDESCKLWLNDKLVWQVYRQKDVPLDHDIVSVFLHPGNNKLLIKVTNSVRDWGFYLRVTDDNGDGFQDIRFRAAELGDPIALHESASE